jgi:hypothetical protein
LVGNLSNLGLDVSWLVAGEGEEIDGLVGEKRDGRNIPSCKEEAEERENSGRDWLNDVLSGHDIWPGMI